MNNKQLEYFITIVNENGIGNAAKVLYVTPSSLSQMVKKLEEELSAELFIRGRKQFQLSYAGRQLYNFAIATAQNYKQMVQGLNDIEGVFYGELVVSMSVKRAASLLSLMLPPFMKKYPGVKISALADMKTIEERERSLVNGNCDFIINSYHDKPLNFREVEYVQVAKEQLVLFVGKNTNLAKRIVPDGIPPKEVQMDEIWDESYLLSAPIYGGRFMVDKLFAYYNKVPRILAQISPVSASLQMVDTGDYNTISAEIIRNGELITPGTRNGYAIPIALDNQTLNIGSRPIFIAYKKHMPLVSFQKDFIDIAIETLSDI